MPYAVSGMRERPAQYVLKDVRAEIADVRVVVYRRPAGIEADLVLADGLKCFFAAGECIVEF